MAEKKSWLKTIGKLKQFLNEVGPLWPNSTKLAGYSEAGPFHCEDCIFLKRDKQGAAVKDASEQGVCTHPVMIADTEVGRNASGFPLVNIEKGCCEFVEQPNKEEENGGRKEA